MTDAPTMMQNKSEMSFQSRQKLSPRIDRPIIGRFSYPKRQSLPQARYLEVRAKITISVRSYEMFGYLSERFLMFFLSDGASEIANLVRNEKVFLTPLFLGGKEVYDTTYTTSPRPKTKGNEGNVAKVHIRKANKKACLF
ncbi:12816_t:CDS:2 [Funneliformis mosseae]|uniref:12816_t:CDS:1 n=1 Tax=Funneliformis mosseae TaxID=27381 RepID=A0A9N8W7E5_FUNMO|nr:12816_t:CDS:2 [Funneliformis mosseae]